MPLGGGVVHMYNFKEKCQYGIMLSIRTGENFTPSDKLSEQARTQRTKMCIIQMANALS